VEASQRLGRPKLLAEARARAGRIVHSAATTGKYRMHAQAPRISDSPSFFQGLSGIGYTLLRVADPTSLPCALLCE
jgi:lantibiotic modifying enzyme